MTTRILTALLVASMCTPALAFQSKDQREGLTFRMQAQPIPGLTRTARELRSGSTLPMIVNTPLDFELAVVSGASSLAISFDWQGAVELTDSQGTSTARFQSSTPGPFQVTAVARLGGLPVYSFSVSLQVHAIEAEDIRILIRAPDPWFAVPVGQPFTIECDTLPSDFATLVEWKAPHHSPASGTGQSFTTRRSVIGDDFPIIVSLPATRNPPRVSVMVFRVQWVHAPGSQEYLSGPVLSLYHEIRTEPPGYEDSVEWRYDTMGTGDAHPTSGKGRTFLVNRTAGSAELICWRTYAGNSSSSGDMPSGDASTFLLGLSEILPIQNPSFQCTLPVGLYNGEAQLRVIDLAVPSRGFPFVWARTYSSRANFNHALGYNWDFTYNRRLFILPSGNATVTNGSMHEDVYSKTGATTYLSPPGQFDELKLNGDGTHTLTDASGMQYRFDVYGYLIEQQDRAGNTLTIARNTHHNPTEIVDTQGRCYTLTYTDNTSSQLTAKITDFLGREVVYTYDSRADLLRVTSPKVTGTPNGNDFPAGKTTLYTYSSGSGDSRLNHNLLAVIDPLFNVNNDHGLSKPWVTLSYSISTSDDNVDFDQVVSERWGHDQGGPPSNPNLKVGGVTSFSYSNNPSGDANWPPGGTHRTIVTDGNGNLKTSYFDSTRHEIKAIAATNRNVRPGEGDPVTQSSFNIDGLLVEKTLPRGNVIQFLHDSTHPIRRSQGNLLEVRRLDASLGSATDLVTRYTYDPVFTRLRTVTDPRAFPSGSVPLDGNGNLDLNDPVVGRYTRFQFFDYQEGTGFQSSRGVPVSEQIPEGLGDLNNAADFNEGNVVKSQEPKIQTSGPNFGAQSSTTFTYNDRGQRLTEKDPVGITTGYEYFQTNGGSCDATDKEGYLKSVTVDTAGLKLKTQFDYDPAGNLARLTDPKGQATDYFVNALNQVVRVLEPALPGNIRYRFDLFYDLNDEMIKTARSNLDETGASYTHSEISNRYELNILHFVVNEILDKSLNSSSATTTVRWEHLYDANMNRIATRSPLAVNGQDPIAVVTRRFDERDLLYQEITADNDLDPYNTPPSLAHVRTLNYNSNGHRVEEIDTLRNALSPNAPVSVFPGSGAGDVTRFEYDGFDRLVRTIDGEGNIDGRVLDLATNPVQRFVLGPRDCGSSTRVLLADQTTVYDEMDRVVTQDRLHFDLFSGANIGDGDGVTTFTYDLESRILAVTDDRGLATTILWDNADRRSRETDSLGNKVEYFHDLNGNVTSVRKTESSTDLGTAANVYTETYSYDALDRLLRTTDPAADITDHLYDSRHNRVKVCDPVRGQGYPNGPGNELRFEYDGLNRLIRTTRELTSNGRGDGSPNGSIDTTQSFDDNSRLIQQVDPGARNTQYVYDALDRRVMTIFSDATRHTDQYDADHHVTSATDPNGTTLNQSFDGLDRLLSRSVGTLGSGVLGSTFENYCYDGLSRVIRAENDDGINPGSMVCSFRFDSHSNRTQENQMGFLVDSGFDGVSNRITLVYPGQFGSGRRSLTTSYDNLNRLRQISDGSGQIATWHYKGPRRLERRNSGVDTSPLVKLDVGYDGNPRAISFVHRTGSGALLAGFEYGHDRMDHRQYEKRLHEGNLGDVFGYDSIYRNLADLQKVNLSGLSAGQEIDPSTYDSCDRLDFGYDGTGNRTTSVEEVACVPTTTTYTQSHNRYTVIQEGGNPPRTLTYHQNGNLKSDGLRKHAYDFKNRLVEVRQQSSNALIAQYSYDADDRRTMKIDHSTGSPVMTHFLFDGDRVIEERDGSNAVIRQYVWGPDGELIQYRATNGTFYSMESAIGSISGLVSTSGSVIERYAYDSFGGTTVTLDGSTGNRFRFLNAYSDSETTHYCMGARYYNPDLGRFLSRDPGGVWASTANLGNPYAIHGNDMINQRYRSRDSTSSLEQEAANSPDKSDQEPEVTKKKMEDSFERFGHPENVGPPDWLSVEQKLAQKKKTQESPPEDFRHEEPGLNPESEEDRRRRSFLQDHENALADRESKLRDMLRLCGGQKVPPPPLPAPPAPGGEHSWDDFWGILRDLRRRYSETKDPKMGEALHYMHSLVKDEEVSPEDMESALRIAEKYLR